MAATYSGNLIAFLTVNKDKLPFDTISELVEQTDYIWGTAGGGTYWETMFEVPQVGQRANLYQLFAQYLCVQVTGSVLV